MAATRTRRRRDAAQSARRTAPGSAASQGWSIEDRHRPVQRLHAGSPPAPYNSRARAPGDRDRGDHPRANEERSCSIVVLAGGRVVDGTGSPWFRADVGSGATGSRRSARSAAPRPGGGSTSPDRVVAPGFVDTHVHADLALARGPAPRGGHPPGRDDVPPGPGRRRDGAGLPGDPRVHAPLHGGVQRALRGGGALVEHGGVPRALRPPRGRERRVPHPERQRPHGRDGARDAPADAATSSSGCAGSSARRWRRARSGSRAGSTTSRAATRRRRSSPSCAGRSRPTAACT